MFRNYYNKTCSCACLELQTADDNLCVGDLAVDYCSYVFYRRESTRGQQIVMTLHAAGLHACQALSLSSQYTVNTFGRSMMSNKVKQCGECIEL